MTLSCVLKCGNASLSEDRADLVFTHPYGDLPKPLVGVPAMINICGKKPHVESWVGSKLTPIATWGTVLNTLYVANIEPIRVNLSDLVEEEESPGHGFMPLELPLRILRIYGSPGITVWDGFMGRGTIGKAALSLGMNYIGIDIDPKRVEMAREYIG